MKTHACSLALALFLSVAPRAAFAADDDKAKPDVSAAPESGLDADLSGTLDAAERKLAERDPLAAMKLVMPVFASSNRFTTAQKPLLLPRSASMLRQAGSAALSAGNAEEGLRAYDAAWQLDAQPDAAYAKALIARADQERAADPAAALWMARRAREVSPDLDLARERDERWSRNRYLVPSYALMIGGLASMVAGSVLLKMSNDTKTEITGSMHSTSRVDELVSTQKTYGLGAGIGLGVGAAAFMGGILLLMAGNPTETPTSPSYLPAFKKEASR